MTWNLVLGDSHDVLAAMDPESVDSIVTDPPYGLEFMGEDWDDIGDTRQPDDETHQTPDNVFGRQTVRYGGTDSYDADNEESGRRQQAWHRQWLEGAHQVLKPGAHLLSFGGSRTYHRLACAAENAGFEVRDMIHWTYGSGFPKSHNLENVDEDEPKFEGKGTALKPSHEPILVARKPLAGTVAENVLEYGVGALNIDNCRIGVDESETWEGNDGYGDYGGSSWGGGEIDDRQSGLGPEGRWPANTILTHATACNPNTNECVKGCPVRELAQQSGQRDGCKPHIISGGESGDGWGNVRERDKVAGYDDGGTAARYFKQITPFVYTAKASRGEREEGLEDKQGKEQDHNTAMKCANCNLPILDGRSETCNCDEKQEVRKRVKNHHPTVKPVALMHYLIRLVTPDNGLILDPFTGSGTTGCAAALTGHSFLGVEREPDYAEIAHARIKHWHDNRATLLEEHQDKLRGVDDADVEQAKGTVGLDEFV